jgi:site-specific recombinase XerC
MRRFVRWLVAEGELEVDVIKAIEQPVAPEVPVPIFSDDELTRLFSSCATKDFRDRRDEAMMRTLLDCGLRIAELAKMTVGGLDLEDEVLFVMGEGSRPRAVPFSAKTARAMDRYLRIRRQHPDASSDRLWLALIPGVVRCPNEVGRRSWLANGLP